MIVKSTVFGQDIRGLYKNTKYTANFLNSNGQTLANTNVEFNIGGKTYSATTNYNGVASLDINMDSGNYIITAINTQTGEKTSNNINIYQIDSTTSITAKQSADIVTLTAKVNSSDATGKVIFTKDNDKYEAILTNGEAKIFLNNLALGQYHAYASYLGDRNHKACESEYISFEVKEFEVFLITNNVSKYYKGPERLEITLIDNDKSPVENANVFIEINGQTMNRTTQYNGKTSIAINLNSGNYTTKVSTPAYNLSEIVNVEVKSTIIGEDISKIEKGPEPYYATFLDTNGNKLTTGKAEFNINGILYYRDITNGVGKLNLNLEAKEYIITATNHVTGERSSNKITITPRFAILTLPNTTETTPNTTLLLSVMTENLSVQEKS